MPSFIISSVPRSNCESAALKNAPGLIVSTILIYCLCFVFHFTSGTSFKVDSINSVIKSWKTSSKKAPHFEVIY